MRTTTLVWACVAVIPAAAQVAGESGAQDEIGQRMVKQFDFLETENLEDVPMFWRRVKGEGFPHFARGRFDRAVGHDAAPSFLLESNGGGVGFFYYARGIPAQPGSDYEVAMWVRPRSLDGARFFASAWFLDRFGSRIEGSERSSELIGGGNPNGEWRPVRLILPGGVPNARLISVALYIMQSSALDADGEDDFVQPIVATDIDAGAWVDDISILRLPRIRLSCIASGSVFRHDEIPTIAASVIDPDGANLRAQLVVRSANGMEQWRQVLSTRSGEDREGAVFAVPGLAPGFYTATLHIEADGKEVRAPAVRFAKLPAIPKGIRQVNRGFGIRVDNANEALWPSISRLTELLNIWQIKIPVWSADRPAIQASSESPGRIAYLAELYRRNGMAVAVLEGVPTELRDPTRAGEQNVLDLFSHPSEHWGAFLKYALARYASFVQFWQIGADGDREIYLDKRMGPTIARLNEAFRELITSPQLAVPVSRKTRWVP